MYLWGDRRVILTSPVKRVQEAALLAPDSEGGGQEGLRVPYCPSMSSHWPQGATEHLQCGCSKCRGARSIKYILHFQGLSMKKRNK